MRIVFLLLTSLLLSACMSMANVDYDRSVNFKSLTTYSIQKEPVKTGEDTRVTTPFMQERIVNAINNELTKKGLSKKDKQPSLNIKYHLSVVKELESDGSTVSFGFGTGGHHTAIGMGFVFPVGETYTVDRLILTIDMLSSQTGTLAWRGSLAYRLDPGATPETYTRMVNDLVAEILRDFPPH